MQLLVRLLISYFLFIPVFVSAQSAVTDYYRFKDSSIHIEGIATGLASGIFYFGGVNTGELYELTDTVIRSYPVPSTWPRWSMLGMKTDASRQMLFISRAALPQSLDTIDKYHASDVIVFDLQNKTFTRRFPLTDRKHLVIFNDIGIAPGGRLLVSDGGRPGGVYELDYENGDFRALNTTGIKSPQGIVVLDTVVYIASYTKGLYRYNSSQDTAVFVPVNNLGGELHFLDGLVLFNNQLVGICNGDQRSIVSIDLKTSRGTRLADLKLPQYSEPTLGTMIGNNLFFISNSQWESYPTPGKQRPMRKPAIISQITIPE